MLFCFVGSSTSHMPARTSITKAASLAEPVYVLFCVSLETESCYLVQAGLEYTILLCAGASGVCHCYRTLFFLSFNFYFLYMDVLPVCMSTAMYAVPRKTRTCQWDPLVLND